ncbi:MAG: hypothetical protein ACPL68_00710, partial [Candidatus Hydrothermia bacterium]
MRTFVAFLSVVGVALGAKYTVTDLADSGPGTLREAITLENANAWPDTVVFDTLAFIGAGYIPISRATQGGESAWRISLATELPMLSDNWGLTIFGDINGNGTPDIVLDGNASVTFGLVLGSRWNIIKGLVISNFTSAGIFIGGTSQNQIMGCWIGTDPEGINPAPNYFGIWIYNSDSNRIGTNLDGFGDELEGNIISGNCGTGPVAGICGLYIYQGLNNQVSGNRIGLGYTGQPCPNGYAGGIYVNVSSYCLIGDSAGYSGKNIISADSTIGILVKMSDHIWITHNYIGTDTSGTASGGYQINGIQIDTSTYTQVNDNIISGLLSSGVLVRRGSYNHIYGNLIGCGRNGNPIGNGGIGVYVYDSSQYNVVGYNPYVPYLSYGNRIAYNAKGIVVGSGPTDFYTVINRLSRNDIYSNVGLGIDLANNGVTVNDPGDPDFGPNFLLNYPVITGATHYDLGDSTVITGTAAVNSTVEVYLATGIVDPTGYGEGIHLATANADGSGNWRVVVPGGPTVGDTITSVCIDQTQSTSEFSPYYTVQNVAAEEKEKSGALYLKAVPSARGILVGFGVP